ncbi:class II lanthipeptide, LchA2/BrtA2 family, partial [Bacillus cereus]
GSIDENELKKVAGAGDVNPETTPATPTIIGATIAVTASLCPTTKCTSRC